MPVNRRAAGPILSFCLLLACASQRPAESFPAPSRNEIGSNGHDHSSSGSSAGGAQADSLGSRRLTRIEVAYTNLANALSEWELTSHGQDCVLVFNETEEWLVGCPDLAGKSGFSATDERWRDQPVLWNGKSFVLSDKFVPYEQIKLSMVGTVGNYTKDSDGEQSQRPVLMLQEWDALHKNHPGFQQSNIEEWLGVFVHEAFHAHQLYHPRVRALVKAMNSENGLATAEELAGFYKQNAAFKEAVKKEYDLLRAAGDDAKLNPAKARRTLAKWLTLYRARQTSFEPALEQAFPGKKAWMMDGFETFLEGSARYVEARFLIAPTESSFAQLSDEPTFKGFVVSKGKRPSELPGLGNIGAKYFYSLGMYLCFVLDVADPSWKSTLFSSDGLLVEQVARSAAGKK
jgi:hypothetical protein